MAKVDAKQPFGAPVPLRTEAEAALLPPPTGSLERTPDNAPTPEFEAQNVRALPAGGATLFQRILSVLRRHDPRVAMVRLGAMLPELRGASLSHPVGLGALVRRALNAQPKEPSAKPDPVTPTPTPQATTRAQAQPELVRPRHDKKLLERLAEKIGPVVDIDQAPELYRTCQQLLVELAPFWQEATTQSGTATVLLVDSPIALAHLDTQEARGVDVVAHTICLSTGLVRNLLGLEGPGASQPKEVDLPRLEQGVAALAGVIAQRLACAVKAAEKTAARMPDYQWEHLEPFWADGRAALGLKHVGLDPKAALLAVELCDLPDACYGDQRRSTFKSWLGHRGEKWARQASLELLLTQQEAAPSVAPRGPMPGVERIGAMVDELRGLGGIRERLHLETYNSVAELVDRGLLPLLSTEPGNLPHDDRALLFNRRLLDLLDRVAKDGQRPRPEDQQAVQRFLKGWMSNSKAHGLAWGAKEFTEKFTADRLAEDYATKPPYAEQVRTLGWFKDEAHLRWSRETLQPSQANLRELVERATRERTPPAEAKAPPAAQLSPEDVQRAKLILSEVQRYGMSWSDAIRHLRLSPRDQEIVTRYGAPRPSRSAIDWASACWTFGDLATKAGFLLPPDEVMKLYGEDLVSFLKVLPPDQRQQLYNHPRFGGPNGAELELRVQVAWLASSWDTIDPALRAEFLRHRAPKLLSNAAELLDKLPKGAAPELRAQYDRLLRQVWKSPERLALALTSSVPWDRLAKANRLDLEGVRQALGKDLLTRLEPPLSAELVALLRGGSAPALADSVAQWIEPAIARRCLLASLGPEGHHPARALLLELARVGLASAPDEAVSVLQSALTTRLAKLPRPISGDDFCREMESLLPYPTRRDGPVYDAGLSAPAAALEQLALSPAERQQLLAAYYSPQRLSNYDSSPKLAEVAETLVRQGVVESPAHLFAQLFKVLEQRSQGADLSTRDACAQTLRGLLANLQGLLHRQIASVRSPEELRELGHVLYPGDPETARPTFAMPNDPNGRELKGRMVAAAARLGLGLADRLELFLRLTTSGGCIETDRYYREQILPVTASADRPLAGTIAKRDADRLVGDEAKTALARMVVEPKVAALEAAPTPGPGGASMQNKRAAFEIANQVNELANTPSALRDELLEEIAWRLKLEGKVLRGLIHERKSRDPNDPEPFFAAAHDRSRYGFHFNDYVGGASPAELRDFLAALVSGDPQAVRQHLRRETEKYLAQETWHTQKSHDDDYSTRHEARLATPKAADRLAPILSVLRALERSGGDRSALLDEVITAPALLHLPDGGPAQQFLKALLGTMEPHQQIVVLARLLAERGSTTDPRPTLVDLGTSFGLEPALSCRLLGLSVDPSLTSRPGLFAAPLTRWELCSVAEKVLAPKDWGRVANLVSAESRGPERTEAKALLKSGTEATLSVVTPRTTHQLEVAAARRRAFLQNLVAQGAHVPPELQTPPAHKSAPTAPVTLVELKERAPATKAQGQGQAKTQRHGAPVSTAGTAEAKGSTPATWDTSPKKVYAKELERIERDIGPVLERADAPVLHGVLGRLFAEALPGQERALDRAFLGELFVIDSTLPTAFTLPVQREGSMESLVFISTGLLRQLMGLEAAWEQQQKAPEFAQIEAAMHQSAGITEHELKHAIYKAEARSRANRFGTAQAEEVEVDSRAAYELYVDPSRSARATGLLDGLASFDRSGAHSAEGLLGRILGESLHSHPEMEGRMVFQRLFLTGLRIELGPQMEKGNLITSDEATAMVGELRAQTAALERENFTKPATIREATQRLEALFDNQRPKNGKLLLEFNRVLLALNELLRRAEGPGRTLSAADTEAVHHLFEVWSTRRLDSRAEKFEPREDWGPYRPFDHQEVRAAMTGENLSAELAQLPCHAVSLARTAFYRSEGHEAWCRARYTPRLQALLNGVPAAGSPLPDEELNRSAFSRLLAEMSVFMPPDRAAELFGRTVLSHPRIASDPALAVRLFSEICRYTDFEGVQPRLFMQLAKRAWPKLSRAERAEFLQGHAAGLLPSAPEKFGVPPVGPQVFRELFMGPDQAAMRADYEWFFREVWADKELFALTAEIPWETVVAGLPTLGLTLEQAKGRLRNGVRAVLGDDHPDPQVKARAAETCAIVEQMVRVHLPSSAAFWADKALLPYFSGEKRLASMSAAERTAVFKVGEVPSDLATGVSRFGYDRPKDRKGSLQRLYNQLTLDHFTQQPEVFRHYFIEHVARELSRHPEVAGSDPRRRRAVFGSIVSRYAQLEGGDLLDRRYQLDLVAEAVIKANLPEKTKAQLLEQHYLSDQYGSEGGRWRSTAQGAERRRILDRLLEHGVLESAAEAVLFLREAFPGTKGDLAAFRARREAKVALGTSSHDPKSYFGLVEDLSDRVLHELRTLDPAAPQAKETLLMLSGALEVRDFREPPKPLQDRYSDEAPSKPKLASTNSSRLRALKGAITEAMAKRQDLDLDTQVEMFRAITSGGPTRDTDQFFLHHLLPKFADDRDALQGFLDAKAVYGHKTRLELVKQVLEPRVEELAALAAKERERPSENLRRGVFELFAELEKHVPDTSYDKDQYLESLGIRLGLKGKDLKGLVEDPKSFNWRRPNPALVNLGTAISGYVKSLAGKDRDAFLQCLMDPTSESVRRETERLAQKLCGTPDQGRDWLQQVGVANAGEAERKIETLLLDAGPLERIPLIALTLDTGPGSLSRTPDYPLNVIRDPKLLGWEPDSLEGILLRSYLNSVDAHEVSASLAYLLAHKHEGAGEGQSSQVKRLFLVFQTVGIKLGQAAAIFRLFGPRIAKEVDDLKDQARDVSLFEAYQTVEEAKAKVEERLKGAYLLPQAERVLLEQELEGWRKVKRIVAPLGSASGKSVWQVELTDGRMVAMALRRSRIDAQVAGNTKLLSRFLDQLEGNLVSHEGELEQRGLEFPVALVRSLVRGFQNQLSREFDFAVESKNIEKAADFFERMDQALADKLRGDEAPEKFKLTVPRTVADLPRTEDVLFMALADGQTLAALERKGEFSFAEHPALGEVMVGACLRGFFREGRAFPDQHKGNFILSQEKRIADQQGRELFALDFGQYEEMQTSRLRFDDRVVAGLFLASLPRDGNLGNPEQLVEMAMRMSRSPRSVDRRGAIERLRVLFARGAGGDRGEAKADGASGLTSTVTETLKILAESKVDFEDRFLVGFFKGLMVLYGEQYVDDTTFRRILGDEVERLLRSHPAAVANLIKQKVLGPRSARPHA